MRRARPWFLAKTDGWYVTQGTGQILLGKHPAGAPKPKRIKGGWNAPQVILDAFHAFMAKGKLPEPDRLSVAQVCDLFLEHAQKHNDARTFAWYDAYLQGFCRAYPTLKAADLKPFHVTKWLDDHPTWKSSRRHAIIAVKRAFNWADREGILSPSPIRGVVKPPVKARPVTLTKAERREILTAIHDRQFREFVEAMQESGARPSEIARLTAADINLELGVCVLHKHKSSGKTGEPRVIYTTPRFLDIVRPLLLKDPDGPLFRGPRLKKRFGMHGICSRFRRLRLRLPHLKNAISYAYRHSFAVDGLMNGVGIAQVAELLGHKDTSMVSRHYGVLSDQISHLRDAARRATA